MATLVNRFGEEIDVTERIELSAVSTFTEEFETETGDYKHSDVALSLRDGDGAMAAQFEGCTSTDIYQFIIDRDTGRRRPRYERMFAGILDLSKGVKIRTSARRVDVKVLSYSKLLEKASAENVRRTLSDVNVNTGSGSTLVTYEGGGLGVEFGFLQPGDSITVTNYTTSETQVIDRVDDISNLHTVDPWTNAFTNGVMTLATPYHRNRTVWNLFGLLLDEAGITDREIDDSTAIFETPICQPIATNGVAASAVPRSLIQYGTPQNIRVVFASGDMRDFSDFVSGAADAGAGTAGMGDLWPYFGGDDSAGAITRDGKSDNGEQCWDYDNVEWYAFTTEHPLLYQLVLKGFTNSAGSGSPAHSKVVDSSSASVYPYAYCDHEAGAGGKVWLSYTNLSAFSRAVKTYDPATDTLATIRTDASGPLRFIAGDMLPGVTGSGIMLFHNLVTLKFEFYDAATATIIKTIDPPSGDPRIWTFRWYEDLSLACVLYHYNGATRLRGWNTPNMDVAFDYVVSATQSPVPLLTGIILDGVTYPFGYAAGNWFVLSSMLVGVVPYANFEGMSCAAALRELAEMAGCYATVDHYKVGKILSRIVPTTDVNARVLDEDPDGEEFAPLEEELEPIWEEYRTSVKVSCDGLDDDKIEVIAGDTGDSANRLDVTADLPMTESMALLRASALLSYVGVERRAVDQTFRIQEELVRPRDQVQLGRLGGFWLVTKATTNEQRRTQDLRLVEIIE